MSKGDERLQYVPLQPLDWSSITALLGAEYENDLARDKALEQFLGIHLELLNKHMTEILTDTPIYEVHVVIGRWCEAVAKECRNRQNNPPDDRGVSRVARELRGELIPSLSLSNMCLELISTTMRRGYSEDLLRALPTILGEDRLSGWTAEGSGGGGDNGNQL